MPAPLESSRTEDLSIHERIPHELPQRSAGGCIDGTHFLVSPARLPLTARATRMGARSQCIEASTLPSVGAAFRRRLGELVQIGVSAEDDEQARLRTAATTLVALVVVILTPAWV